MIAVSIVTRDAERDDLENADYREIYEELRQAHSLREFVALIHTQYSIAWWSKYERGETGLTRPARNELRMAVGMGPLPLTVGQATAQVDDNAVVYRVGDRAVERVVLVGEPGTIAISVNGECRAQALEARVTEVTRRARRAVVSVRPELWQRLNEARQAAGLTWEQMLERALPAGD